MQADSVYHRRRQYTRIHSCAVNENIEKKIEWTTCVTVFPNIDFIYVQTHVLISNPSKDDNIERSDAFNVPQHGGDV